MKYCVPYYQDFRYFSEIDEIILYYSENDNLVEFVKQNYKDNQRVIIDIVLNKTEDTIPILKKLQQEHEDMAVRLQSDNNYELLREAGIPYFFDNFCNTDEEVYVYVKSGASDVYVAETLGFSLEKISAYCHNKGVKVRVIPNIAQHKATLGKYIPDYYKFFIRPEDTEIYEKYVDVFEFVAPGDRLSVFYSVYKGRVWFGDLKNLIIGIQDNIYNPGIAPFFGPQRLNCEHKCMQEKCNVCGEICKVAEKFKNLELEIRRTVE